MTMPEMNTEPAEELGAEESMGADGAMENVIAGLFCFMDATPDDMDEEDEMVIRIRAEDEKCIALYKVHVPLGMGDIVVPYWNNFVRLVVVETEDILILQAIDYWENYDLEADLEDGDEDGIENGDEHDDGEEDEAETYG